MDLGANVHVEDIDPDDDPLEAGWEVGDGCGPMGKRAVEAERASERACVSECERASESACVRACVREQGRVRECVRA